eukprot:2755688-Pleurochrysis_carterae.AAC.1
MEEADENGDDESRRRLVGCGQGGCEEGVGETRSIEAIEPSRQRRRTHAGGDGGVRGDVGA